MCHGDFDTVLIHTTWRMQKKKKNIYVNPFLRLQHLTSTDWRDHDFMHYSFEDLRVFKVSLDWKETVLVSRTSVPHESIKKQPFMQLQLLGMKIFRKFCHVNSPSNPYEYLSFVEQKIKYFEFEEWWWTISHSLHSHFNCRTVYNSFSEAGPLNSEYSPKWHDTLLLHNVT